MNPKFLNAARSLLAPLLSVALLGTAPVAHAGPGDKSPKAKIAPDLEPALNSTAGVAPLPVTWAKRLDKGLYVKALLVANSADPTLAALRKGVLAAGGSVHYNYLSVRALAVLLPVGKIEELAARDDVIGITPNRAVTRTAVSVPRTTPLRR